MVPVNSLFKVQTSAPYITIGQISLAFDSLDDDMVLHTVLRLLNLSLLRPSLVFTSSTHVSSTVVERVHLF